jgi:hypothetical protein
MRTAALPTTDAHHGLEFLLLLVVILQARPSLQFVDAFEVCVIQVLQVLSHPIFVPRVRPEGSLQLICDAAVIQVGTLFKALQVVRQPACTQHSFTSEWTNMEERLPDTAQPPW